MSKKENDYPGIKGLQTVIRESSLMKDILLDSVRKAKEVERQRQKEHPITTPIPEKEKDLL